MEQDKRGKLIDQNPPRQATPTPTGDSEKRSLGAHEDYVRSLVRRTPGWPKAEVTFLDLSPVLCDVPGFRHCIDALVSRYSSSGVTHVAGIDARGFTFGSALAYAMGCGFVMLRKGGKLPPSSTTAGDSYSLLSECYDLEYGKAELQLGSDIFDHHDSANSAITPKVVIVDDLLATGGTAVAACRLLRAAGAVVVEVAVAIELVTEGLHGREKLKEKANVELFSLLTF